MKLLKLLSFLLLVCFVSGCLWVCRVPIAVKQDFSDDGVCTNAVYKSMITSIRENPNTNLYCSISGLYPLTRMRIDCVYHAFKGRNLEGLKGRDLYEAKWTNRAMPIGSILIWIGEPLDLVIDTIMIPWDW